MSENQKCVTCKFADIQGSSEQAICPRMKLIELEDILARDQLGGNRASQQVAVRRLVVAHADVAIAVHDPFGGQDAVSRNQVLDQLGVGGPGSCRLRPCPPRIAEQGRAGERGKGSHKGAARVLFRMSVVSGHGGLLGLERPSTDRGAAG